MEDVGLIINGGNFGDMLTGIIDSDYFGVEYSEVIDCGVFNWGRDILIKRGEQAGFSSVLLKEGEPAFVTDTGKLYVGTASGKVLINDKYVHPSGDGNSHVPTTGTNNNGYYLKAGATADSAAWVDFAADVRAAALTGFSTSTTTITEDDSVLIALGKAQGQIETKVSIKHASSDDKYGSATDTHYGHVKVTAENGLAISQGTLSMSAASTSSVGTVKLNSSTDSNSFSEATTPSAVKATCDLANTVIDVIDNLVIDGGTF